MNLLEAVKNHLRIDGEEADAELQRLIESAKAECRRYTGIEADAPEFDAADVVNGLILAVEADYDADPSRREVYMTAARALWQPVSRHFGV